MYESVGSEVHDHVLTITLDRPERPDASTSVTDPGPHRVPADAPSPS